MPDAAAESDAADWDAGAEESCAGAEEEESLPQAARETASRAAARDRQISFFIMAITPLPK